MTYEIPVSESAVERMTRWYHRFREKCGLGLHRFVRTGEEDAVRMRRRLHIHVALLTCTGAMSFCGLWGIVSLTAVTGTSTGVILLQEIIDSFGQF